MGSSTSAWIINLALVLTVIWLIKSITAKPQVIKYESQILGETGKKVVWSVITIYQLANGKIIRDTFESNTLDYYQQLGVLKPSA